jgi:phosphoglycolate phosphatase-like HAD superfamily hydrolase
VFRERWGRPETFDTVRFHGMTDRAIIRDGLERIGVPADDVAIDEVCATYLTALADEMPRSTRFRVLSGASALLDALARRPGLAVGLGTGNLREGARLKLEHAGLFHHFAFGGFGCDHEDRAALLRVGAVRGAERLGRALDACRVVVIGDTPRDVAAARAIGAESLTVETGGIAGDALRDAGATWTHPDLTDPAILTTLIG